jgi:hypothetical protein
VGATENNRAIRSRHAAHRATKYPIGCLLGASSISIPTSPDASPRVIAPGTPRLKLRNAPVVTFHVTIGAFGQACPKPASLPFRNCRFLGVRNRQCCCRRNPKHQQKHRHSVKVQHRVPILGPASIEITASRHQITRTHPIAPAFYLESCSVDRSHCIGVGEILSRFSFRSHPDTSLRNSDYLNGVILALAMPIRLAGTFFHSRGLFPETFHPWLIWFVSDALHAAEKSRDGKARKPCWPCRTSG